MIVETWTGMIPDRLPATAGLERQCSCFVLDPARRLRYPGLQRTPTGIAGFRLGL
jgi:hypothetical protein